MAAGLLYLADRGIVHTNVSLRSCLLSHANSVKLAGLKYARLHRDPSFCIDPADPALPYKVRLPRLDRLDRPVPSCQCSLHNLLGQAVCCNLWGYRSVSISVSVSVSV